MREPVHQRVGEERFRLLVEHASDWMWEVNQAGVYTYSSPQVEALLGYTPAEVLGKTPFDLMPPEEARRVSGAFKTAIERGQSIDALENVNLHADGRRVVLETCGVPIHDEDGRVIGYRGADRDITPRKRAEEETRRQRAQLAMINSCLLSLGVDYVQNVNRLTALCGELLGAGFAVYGRLRGETLDILGRWRLPAAYVDDEARVGHLCFDVIQTEAQTPQVILDLQESPYLKTDPNVAAQKLKSYVGQPVFCGSTCVGALCVAYQQDAGLNENALNTLQALASALGSEEDRRQAKEDVQRAEVRFRTIYNSASEALMVLDQEGFLDCNATTLALFGVGSVPDFCALHPADVSPPEQADGTCSLAAADARIAQAIRDGSHSFEWLHRRLDTGEVFPAEVILTAMQLDGRQVLHASVRDIAERKEREEEAREVEVQLQQTQRLESLGILAGGIAHDFNNILMAIMGHAELALSEMAPESHCRENLTGITDATKRAAELCGQMLAYSGKGRLETQDIALTALIEDVQHMLKISISKKCVLRLALDRGLPCMHGDPTQIRQVIMNLVINASEAIGDRSGTIQLASGAMEYAGGESADGFVIEPGEPGTCLYVAISDSGQGIAPEQIHRIFDPFFTTKFTGRGLGLSAVLGIVRAHRGALMVDSRPGEGTTFRVLFPVSETPARLEQSADTGSDWRGEGTVLLVDDEDSIRTVSAKLLQRLGLNVMTAADGQEAVELYRQHQSEISLVLLDLTMPRMSGDEAFVALRELNPDVRIVLASGYSETDIASRFSGQDLDGCLQKPYTLQKLRGLLTTLI